MAWSKEIIIIESGEEVEAQAPVIISASRSTDIPALYSDWFIERFKKGYLKWKNPFNGVPLYVSFKNTRIIAFWSKNPEPMMKHLDYLDSIGMNYYFQFSLNDYDNEKLEAKVGSVDSRIKTFIELSEKIGKEKVIWRFDPYILTNKTDVKELLTRTKYIGDKLKGYTNKMVFSFADIAIYRKVKNNLDKFSSQNDIEFIEFDEISMNELATGLQDLNKEWNFEIGTCAEKVDLDKYGIVHNKCIDDDLMKNLFKEDVELMKFLGFKLEKKADIFDPDAEDILVPLRSKKLKDKGQREACGCIMSKDIGQYNTCTHECVYCYANTSIEIAKKNYNTFKSNRKGETITGE